MFIGFMFGAAAVVDSEGESASPTALAVSCQLHADAQSSATFVVALLVAEANVGSGSSKGCSSAANSGTTVTRSVTDDAARTRGASPRMLAA
jgi:hypothetical protein